ncbi:hypothetical protein CLV47_10861 [Antricoccus suffuscus]|uniref:Uncharacterized protein n=1 Tax=Antricoccus suffuscus TaxID=1629062 RepID=A0A2T0ZZC7_9ACTN|nr:hypothetical protein CLV47_10861 [Antricoccus suffuscus]
MLGGLEVASYPVTDGWGLCDGWAGTLRRMGGDFVTDRGAG